jgi:hypothetical protein
MTEPQPVEVSARDTLAVMVGIDRYAADPEWRLHGPVDDAARFARWFLDRGVPAEQVVMLTSPVPGDEAAAVAPPVPARPATAATVRQVLLREVPRRTGRLLWVIWGGHGFIDAQRRRRLYYADATPEDPVNLDLDAMLASLASDLMPSFDHQIWMVDACQIHGVPARQAWVPGTETYPRGAPVPGRRQDVLFAAGFGQSAANLGRQRTGLFSRELLRLLGEHRGGFPPDPRALTERLRDRFGQLRENGLTAQTPTYLWFRDWLGNEGQVWQAGPGMRAPAGRASRAQDDRVRNGPAELALLREAVDALLEIEEFRTTSGRHEILELMRPDISSALPLQPTVRLQAISLLRTCRRFSGGLPELLEAVRFFAAGTAAMERFAAAVSKLADSGSRPPTA